MAITGTGNVDTSFSSKLIEPLSIGWVPTIELNNVVFPDPLGPISPTILSFSTAKEIFWLALTPPKYLKPGDVVELGIEGLGNARQHVKAYN